MTQTDVTIRMEVPEPTSATPEGVRIICWNVNGVRAILKKLDTTLEKLFQKWAADIVCFQEAKIPEDSVDSSIMHVPGFESFWSFSKKKRGYSGVVTYCRLGLTVDAQDGFGAHVQFDDEGRTVRTDHGAFLLFNVYFPNAGTTRERLEYKLNFYHAFQKTCDSFLAAGRQIVVVGDFNTAHLPLDVADQKLEINGTLFAPERAWFTNFLQKSGFVDVFREAHPNERGHYTWFEHIGYRQRNEGMRIDYTLVSKILSSQVLRTSILGKQLGSDHVPLELVLRKSDKMIEMQKKFLESNSAEQTFHPLSSHHKLLQAKAKERQQPKILSFFGAKAQLQKPSSVFTSSSSSPSSSSSSSSAPLPPEEDEEPKKKQKLNSLE